MYDPCEFCQYASEATDIDGKIYYQCDLDDNPDNHSDAVCNGVDDGIFK